MRIRRALAGAAAVAALATGLAATPAAAADSNNGTRVTFVETTGDFEAAASWHTIDEFFWRQDCEFMATYMEVQYNWIMRCYGGGVFSNWQLQRYY